MEIICVLLNSLTYYFCSSMWIKSFAWWFLCYILVQRRSCIHYKDLCCFQFKNGINLIMCWFIIFLLYFTIHPVLFDSFSVWSASCRGLWRVYLKGSVRLHPRQLYSLWELAVPETGAQLQFLKAYSLVLWSWSSQSCCITLYVHFILNNHFFQFTSIKSYIE